MSSLKIKENGAWKTVGSSKDNIPPPPITNFQATVDGSALKLTWTNPIDTDFVGLLIVRKTGSYPAHEADGAIVYDVNKIDDPSTVIGTQYVDTSVAPGITYYYRAFPYDFDNNYQADTGQQDSERIPVDDLWGTPGPLMLANGTMQEGFFGLVPSSQFITGDALASAITLGDGISQFSTTDWIKSAGGGKILFSPMKTIRHSISWDHIFAKGAVWGDGTTGGDRTVQVQGFTFKVRLFRGLSNSYDPKTVPAGYNGVHCHGSEWNRLILPLHVGAKTGSWGDYGANVESGLPYWGTDFTDQDLQTHSDYGNGSYSWCQNYAYSSTYRCNRGHDGVAYSGLNSSSITTAVRGWRPVLELVTD